MQTKSPTVEELVEDALRDCPPLPTIKKTAEILGVDPSTVGRWIRAKRIRAAKLTPGNGSGGVRIPRGELHRLLTESMARAAG